MCAIAPAALIEFYPLPALRSVHFSQLGVQESPTAVATVVSQPGGGSHPPEEGRGGAVRGGRRWEEDVRRMVELPSLLVTIFSLLVNNSFAFVIAPPWADDNTNPCSEVRKHPPPPKVLREGVKKTDILRSG